MIAAILLTAALAQDCPNGVCSQPPAVEVKVQKVSQPVRRVFKQPMRRVFVFGRRVMRGCCKK